MTPRIHLHEYSRAEVEAMEAGPLLDWLVWQAMGFVPVSVGIEWRMFVNGALAMSRGTRTEKVFYQMGPKRGARHRVSTDPGAAMGALIWLADKMKEVDRLVMPCPAKLGGWRIVAADPGRGLPEVKCFAWGDTMQLAIARAVVVFGLERVKVHGTLTCEGAGEFVKELEKVREQIERKGEL